MVRKHFPGQGWYNGEVTAVRWNHSSNQWDYQVEYENKGDGEEGDDDDDDDDVEEDVDEGNDEESDDESNNIHSEVVEGWELKDIMLPKGRHVDPTVYPFKQFVKMWEELDAEAIELFGR